MKPQHWLVKQEPETYPWEAFVRDRRTAWEGVRNYQARNNLKSMRAGDRVLFYASGDRKAVIGLAEVTRELAVARKPEGGSKALGIASNWM